MRRLVCAVAMAAAVVACSEPPTKEHDQARQALEAARAAEAGTYAAAELRNAEEAFAGYDAAVSQRDYRLALSLAIDAREAAYNAARHAADEKTRARAEAEALLTSVEQSLTAVEQRLSGKTGPRPARLAATRLAAAVKSSTATLQKARARMTANDYRGVIELLTPVRDALAAEAPPPASARGRAGR